MSDTKTRALRFLQEHEVAVLATTEADEPHAATVYYECTSDFKLRFLTHSNTRKAKQMLSNPSVAFVIYDEEKVATMQGYGKVEKVTDGEVISGLLKSLMEQKTGPEHGWAPPVEKQGHANIIAMEISPKHMRFSDFGDKSPEPHIMEINF